MNPKQFRLSAADLHPVGRHLNRPENCIANSKGDIWVADSLNLVIHIDPNGNQRKLYRGNKDVGSANGIALLDDGSFMVALIDSGKFARLLPSGELETIWSEFNGTPLGAPNYIERDLDGGLWLSVSTRTQPRNEALEHGINDGYILYGELGRELSIATDGLAFANEIRLSPDKKFIYAAETAKGRVMRYPIISKGSLGEAEIFGPSPIYHGAKVDGITFDDQGYLWVTEITRNAIIILSPDGSPDIVYEDPMGTTLNFPTSLTFAGHDLKTALVGSLKMDHLMAFQSPTSGLPLPHWRY